MARRFLWIPVAAVLALSSFSSPWSSRGTAEAGPGPKPIAMCKDDLGRTKQELTDARAEITRLQASQRDLQMQVDKMQGADRQRQQKLQAQLGAPMIERLH